MLSRLSAISGIAARQYTSQNSLLRAGTLSAYKSPFHTSPHNMVMDKIVYTHADEAPALATYSLLPIIQRFAKPLGVSVVVKDISVSGRIIAHFPENLTEEQKQNDELAELGELAKTPDANIVKLPNVSASVPQLIAAIAELQSQGYNIPNFPASPTTDEEKEIAARYAKVLGSAVNPVLREGNSDRRAAPPVKRYAQKNPHKMGAWDSASRSHVSHMEEGDFYGSEQSYVMPDAGSVKITLKAADGAEHVLKPTLALQKGEVIDAARMSVKALCAFYEKEINECFDNKLMLSLHLKATMMKVSDPILFGHCIKVYFKDVFEKHAALFKELGINANDGLGSVYDKVKGHAKEEEVKADIAATYEKRPGLAMVDSGKGITNLHVPSDVIIDASMPVVVRDSGKMWNLDDALEDVKCMIPDRCYARMYKTVLDDCRENGQFDVSTMGTVPNVGLMAQKAEEYGSHDKTFEIPKDGVVQVTDQTGNIIFEHAVETGDLWRMCQTKDEPIKDWVKLAVTRAKATGAKAIFWLDENRPHDANLLKLAKEYLKDHDTTGLDIGFAAPADACQESCTRARAGLDSISCTGNVLRDYLTDLFPILELGTSAKMLSVVPLLKGGVLLETGAGGSAPKHVQQFVKEGHLRWDSLGEYLATAISFQEMGARTNNPKATLLGDTLMDATGRWLDERKAPSRKVKQIDNRGSSFYVGLYWAQEMAKHDESFKNLATALSANEEQISKELIDCQGPAVDIGGYFRPDAEKVNKAMRPCELLNDILEKN